jgi:hypothetical protein
MGYNIRILNDVVSRMTSLLRLLQILALIGVFEGSYSETLMEAFREALVDEKNVAIYINALIVLGAAQDFEHLLERSFSSFDEQCMFRIPYKNLRIMIPGCRRNPYSYVFIQNHPDSPGSNLYAEHLIAIFWRVTYDGICKGLIPVGAKLYDSYLMSHKGFFSSNNSNWSNWCPKCDCKVEDCTLMNHTDPQHGLYPNLGRHMFKRIVSKMALKFFWRFCFQYAKFSVSLMLNPIALSQVSFNLLDDNQCKFMIPFLPSRYKPDRSRTVEMLFGILDSFQELQIGNQSALVPKPCMLLLEPSSKMGFLTKGSMAHRLAGSLVGSQFKEAIIMRVLISPNMKRLGLFRAQNRSFCKEILKVLRMYRAPAGLISIFEAFL